MILNTALSSQECIAQKTGMLWVISNGQDIKATENQAWDVLAIFHVELLGSSI